ncbi:MAG TPA: hypothetical protein PK997_01965 [Candidatus Omnitrophota bacterium]|nr:hypothetical protein [Candidatus Omnitrophota bacterium]HQB93954.1 hypothetical protein [Candidatus Omnitrophota bacterium]
MRYFLFLIAGLLALTGCQRSAEKIPGVPDDHPAQGFYRFVSANPVSDRVCREYKGDPSIPAGKVASGEGYTKVRDLASGVVLFTDNATGKRYFGVAYLQYQAFLQIPKLCAWEENKQGTGSGK